MTDSTPKAGRGRPRQITLERIVEAGLDLGLPAITGVAIATRLGVSNIALYKHVSGADHIRQLVAEAMFLRWPLPQPPTEGQGGLAGFMGEISASMWDLVMQYPGIAPYMLREDMITGAMLEKMAAHQRDLAEACGISFGQAHWLLFTVTYFCIAVADTVLPLKLPDDAAGEAGVAGRLAQVRAQYDLGARALISGSLAMLKDYPFDAGPASSA